MSLFSIIGEIVLTIFSYIGAVIYAIIHLPTTIRGIISEVDTDKIKESGSQTIKKTVEKAQNFDKSQISDKINDISTKIEEKKEESGITLPEIGTSDENNGSIMVKNVNVSSKEKENAVLKLQISSAVFIITCILYLFKFIGFWIFIIIGLLLIAFIVYSLYNEIRMLYPDDFNAYRDFFGLYILIGVLLVLVGGSTSLSLAFPFNFFPSFSILIFAILGVVALFLLFRIKYRRDYTIGEIIDLSENTAHVRIDYDIRSNVKPDLYIVERPSNLSIELHDLVKIRIESSLFNLKGNRPTEIFEKIEFI